MGLEEWGGLSAQVGHTASDLQFWAVTQPTCEIPKKKMNGSNEFDQYILC